MKSTLLAAITTVLVHTGLSIGAAHAQSELFHQQSDSLHTESGMLLGVYANTTPSGLKIVGTIPGYSAEGRLFKGDLLLQATAQGMPTFSIRSHKEMEHAKSQIGPFRESAIEFFRPGKGLMYAWVTFKPIGGGGAVPHGQDPQPAFSGSSASSGGQGFNPGPGVNPGPSGNSNNVSPNNTVMKMEHQPGGNSNNQQLRSGRLGGAGLNRNPNNNVPFSANVPSSPNNFTPRSSNNAAPHRGKFQAEFRLESEKPGARRLFNRGGRGGGDGFSSGQQSGRQLAPLQQQLQQLKNQQRRRAFGR